MGNVVVIIHAHSTKIFPYCIQYRYMIMNIYRDENPIVTGCEKATLYAQEMKFILLLGNVATLMHLLSHRQNGNTWLGLLYYVADSRSCETFIY